MRLIGFLALCGHTYIHVAAGSKSHLHAHAGSIYHRCVPKRTPTLGFSFDLMNREPEVILRIGFPCLQGGNPIKPVNV